MSEKENNPFSANVFSASVYVRSASGPEQLETFLQLSGEQQKEVMERLVGIMTRIQGRMDQLVPLVRLLDPSDQFLVACTDPKSEDFTLLVQEYFRRWQQLRLNYPQITDRSLEHVKALPIIHAHATTTIQRIRTLEMLKVPGIQDLATQPL